MATKHGRFVWFELVTPQVDEALAFYPEVIGWGRQEMDMGDFVYNMLTAGEKAHSGVTKPQMEGVPSHWASYLSVADVDATAHKVTENGGTVIVAPFDIPNVGRTALVADPQGATLFLFKAAESDDGGSEAFHWNELWARDAEAVLPFYEAVFGFGTQTMQMPNGDYHVLVAGETMIGGVMTSQVPEAPPMWLPYIEVDDCDEVVARAKDHGADVKFDASTTPGVGRFAIFADSTGAVVGVITPERRE